MVRKAINYANAQTRAVDVAGAVDITKPEEGYFRHKLRSGGVYGGVRIFYGPPRDPVTGEEMDRSWRWQALFNDELVEFDDVWPACAGEPLSEEEYQTYCERQLWARQHAKGSAYADPKKRIDLLSSQHPLPF